MKYDYPDYAASRLVGTFVRVKATNDIVIVTNVNDNFVCRVETLEGDVLDIHIDHLNLKPPRLGYINRNNDCIYVVRMPKRQDWKQGSRYENLTAINDHGSASTRFQYRDLVEMIKGSFPSVKECFKRVSTGKRTAMAFDYDFGFKYCEEDKGERCVYVLYGGMGIVGTYNGSQFKLDDQYKYLKERISVYESKSAVQSRSKKG